VRGHGAAVAVWMTFLSGLTAASAGPYDGKWVGQGQNSNCLATTVTLTVTDGTVSGGTSAGGQFYPTKIGADGRLSLQNKTGRTYSVVFSPDKFELHGVAQCGQLDVIGHRA
jgi:hypothetical protein